MGFEPTRRCNPLRHFECRALGQTMRPLRGSRIVPRALGAGARSASPVSLWGAAIGDRVSQTVRPSRKPAKNEVKIAEHSSSSTPATNSIRWLNRRSWGML